MCTSKCSAVVHRRDSVYFCVIMLLTKLSEKPSFTKTTNTTSSTVSSTHSNLITKCVYQYLYRRPRHQHHQMKHHYASNHHHHHRILSTPALLGTGMLPLNVIYIAIAIVFITIINSQLASGALNNSVNNDSDNYYNNSNYLLSDSDSSDNSSRRNVYNSVVDNYYLDDNDDWKSRLHSTSRLRRTPIYQNEFAVYIPSGSETADSIAAKYGFTNAGQVSLLSTFMF